MSVFELVAQPLSGICSNGVPKFELLLRLQGADGQLQLPGDFLQLAERSDLVQQVDRWVFAQAAELLARHVEAGHDISLSVNMSGRSLEDPQLLPDLAEILAHTPIPPARLVVEITETAAIEDLEQAEQVAAGLRALGCELALDDFGAGFACLVYAKRLNFDYLKIDGEFIRALADDPTDELVVRLVVEIARGLGAKTVAESVGDDATVELLRRLGVDYGQGFHLGRPAPLADILPVCG